MKEYSAITEAIEWLNHACMCDLVPEDVEAVQLLLVEAKTEHQFLLDKIAKLEAHIEYTRQQAEF